MYRVLDQHSLVEYLATIPRVAEYLGDLSSISIDEIGNGNLNFVFRAQSGSTEKRAVIVKQAVPYLRMAGEEWPLARDRMTFEIAALALYNQLVPGFVPEILHADEEMSVLVMEYLADHTIPGKRPESCLEPSFRYSSM